jgi:hypothetical protein
LRRGPDLVAPTQSKTDNRPTGVAARTAERKKEEKRKKKGRKKSR